MNQFTIYEARRSNQAMATRPPFQPLSAAQAVLSIGFDSDENVVIERKSVPSDVVKRELDKACAALEKERGRAPGRKERKELKEAIATQLLGTAFAKRKTIQLQWIADMNLLLVGSTTSADLDAIITLLVRCEEGLEVSPLHVASNTSAMLTAWVAGNTQPDDFDLGRTVTLGTLEGARVSFRDYDLESQEVQDQASRDDRSVVSLDMFYRPRELSFTLNPLLQVRNFKVEGVLEDADLGLERKALVQGLLGLFGRAGDAQ